MYAFLNEKRVCVKIFLHQEFFPKKYSVKKKNKGGNTDGKNYGSDTHDSNGSGRL